MAAKFVSHSDYCLAKGVVESKLGNYPVANEYLLASRELAWCKVLPDLFYYYWPHPQLTTQSQELFPSTPRANWAQGLEMGGFGEFLLKF